MTEQAKPFKPIQYQINTQAAPPLDKPNEVERAGLRSKTADFSELPPEKGGVLDKWVAAGRINWELVFWVVIIGLAIVTRLWDLAPRAMHHDENNHSWFSYDMYKGLNTYRYDPTWHGPFLYYMVTFSYFILGGATEFSSRFAPAMFGIGLVAICYLLRPLIGKIGALVFAVLILVSPSILYYSRSLRHDIFATFGTLLFVIALFRFAQSRAGKRAEIRWMALAGLGFFILFSSHEMSFLNLAIVLTWLGIVFLFEIIVLPWRGLREDGRRKTEDEESRSGDGGQGTGVGSQTASPEMSDFDDELDNPLLDDELESPLFFADADMLEVAPPQPNENASPTPNPQRSDLRPQSWLSSFKLVFAGLFALFGLLVVSGAVHLFIDKTADGSLQKLFGINAYFELIPLYLLVAAGIAFLLAKFISFGYRGLSRIAGLVAIITAGVTFVILSGVATLLFLRGASPAKLLAAVNVQFSGNSNPTLTRLVGEGYSPFNDFSYVGLKWPSLVPQLGAIVVAALLLGLLAGWLWERRMLVYSWNGAISAGIVFCFVLVLATLISLRFVLVAPGAALPKGNLLLLGTVDKWVAYTVGGTLIALVIGFIAGWFVTLAERYPDSYWHGSTVLRAIVRFARNPWTVGALLLTFGIPYVLLFSNFFFSPERLADGFYRGLEYWSEQHDLRRLDEPWFYYPMLMLLYETFAVIFTFTALIYFPINWWRRTARRERFVFSAKGVFIGLSFWWSFLALIAYSIAGEKVPWLNMQVAMPFSLATAAFLNDYLARRDWKRILAWKEGLLFAVTFILMFAATLVLIGQSINFPRLGIYSPELSREATSSDIALAITGMVLVGAAWLGLFGFSMWLWWSYRLQGRTARSVIVLVTGLLVLAYCIRSTILLNYDHPDTASEPMIYTQTTPAIPLFVKRVERLGRDIRDSYKLSPPPANPGGLPPIDPDPGGYKGLPIFVSGEAANPFNWYFRDYNNITWGTVKTDLATNPIDKLTDSRGNNYVIIMVSTGENTSRLQQQLAGQYTPHQYKVRWNFPEDESGYGGLGYVPPDDFREYRIAVKDIINTRWDLMWRSLVEQPYAGRLWRYLMYRQLWLPLPSFDMVAYVRNDVEADFVAGSDPLAPPADPNATYDLTASSTLGSANGQYKIPRNLAVAPNGDILVLDSLNGRVQRFDRTGKFISKFGSAGTGDGQFALPRTDLGPAGIATDEDGNIYVADTWGYRIEKFGPDGQFLLKWGDGQATGGDITKNQQFPTSFYGPRSIAYDKTAGELFITDTGNHRVVVYDKQGQFKRQFGSRGSGPGQFDEPVGLAIGPDSKLYITDLRNRRVQVLDQQGGFDRQIAVPEWAEAALSEPYLTFDSQGDLYVSVPTTGTILRFDQAGQVVASYNLGSGANLLNPVGLVFDSDGNLYVADAKRHAIVKIKP